MNVSVCECVCIYMCAHVHVHVPVCFEAGFIYLLVDHSGLELTALLLVFSRTLGRPLPMPGSQARVTSSKLWSK